MSPTVSPTAPAVRPPSSVVDGAETRNRAPTADVERAGTDGLWAALEEVMDPEIPISLVDLGLIYDVRREGGAVEVDLTFTATACPCMAFIRYDIEERLLREPGVETVRIQEVWNPPWTKARITERGRAQLKQLGVAM